MNTLNPVQFDDAINAFVELKVYKTDSIRANYANLKHLKIPQLEAMLKNEHLSNTTKGLIFLMLQKRRLPKKPQKLPIQQFVCV